MPPKNDRRKLVGPRPRVSRHDHVTLIEIELPPEEIDAIVEAIAARAIVALIRQEKEQAGICHTRRIRHTIGHD